MQPHYVVQIMLMVVSMAIATYAAVGAVRVYNGAHCGTLPAIAFFSGT